MSEPRPDRARRRERILCQTDPLALLQKQTIQEHQKTSAQQTQYSNPHQEPIGCLGLAVSAFIVVAFVIAYLL